MIAGGAARSARRRSCESIRPRARHANLTSFDIAAAAGDRLASARALLVQQPKGRPIHNLIVLPPHFDPAKKYPLLVMIHGGAASTNPDQIGLRWNYHLLAAPGYVVLMTDYTGSTGRARSLRPGHQGRSAQDAR